MKPTDRETAEAVSDEIQDALSSNDRARKHAEGAHGGSIGDDISDGSSSGGIAAMEAESVAARSEASMDEGSRHADSGTIPEEAASTGHSFASSASDDEPGAEGADRLPPWEQAASSDE